MAGESAFRRAGILGTGLIGGSLGLALKKRGLVEEVLGYDRDASMLERACGCGAVDAAASGPRELARSCDLVFIAVPVRSIPGAMRELATHLGSGTVVSDVGSVKGPVVRAAREVLGGGCRFIGGHPLAGSEQRGVEFADPDLFRDAYYVLTPGRDCDADAYAGLHALLGSMGARVIAMDPELHDRAVSVISHLPHVLAAALMNLALDRADEYPLLRLAAGGFRDMTRIAASHAGLWLDILVENREAVRETLRECMTALERVEGMLLSGEEGELSAWLERARGGRQKLAPALRESLQELYSLVMPVVDRPGVISEVTLAVGGEGINIDDIELVHPLESGRGLLRLSVRGGEAAARAARALRERGYRVSVSKALGEA
ncbi:MAG: prephenate dehydrogenase/arogenate dehydrogenase family protein [Actinobacteria bacterium]|nr:prephenate dehydrogenase/arogenate dehydrogenase family protein [Actinomycetota bacterium]MDI6829806.1 prephenate dehydrogenase/arogenate dehydrogenase family protein [Actinomycetota bacterium]